MGTYALNFASIARPQIQWMQSTFSVPSHIDMDEVGWDAAARRQRFEDMPGLGFCVVGVLKLKDDVRDGGDDLGPGGVVLLALITVVVVVAGDGGTWSHFGDEGVRKSCWGCKVTC